MIVAHIGGVPVEETLLLVLTGGTSGGLLLARAWVGVRMRRRREEPEE